LIATIFSFVIPAKAGIHFDLAFECKVQKEETGFPLSRE